ncbi:MAG: DHH family phosphoesterase [Bacteroidaceae bacterium]|nr:DHH family phosphoesterase [Bacteroidaceae bacterium]
MLQPTLTPQELQQLIMLLKSVNSVFICAHRSPDGDAMGSAIGWGEYLKNLGKKVYIAMPNPCPDFLRWMPGSQNVAFYSENPEEVKKQAKQADLICYLDMNDARRLQDMHDAVVASKAKRLIIDHHLDPLKEGIDLIISRPTISSTSELVLRLIVQLGGFEQLSRSAAACIYTGMMTDTGSFTYNSNDPELYNCISLLLQKRIDKDRIYRNVHHTFSEHRLRLQGYILYQKTEFFEGRRAAIFTLTRDEMKEFHYIRGDMEGVVNMPLQVKGMRLCISLREDTEKDVIRVSLRSVDDFPCNKMAEEFFNGGGHLNASGGELPFPMESAIETAKKAIEAYKELLYK